MHPISVMHEGSGGEAITVTMEQGFLLCLSSYLNDVFSVYECVLLPDERTEFIYSFENLLINQQSLHAIKESHQW